MKIFATENTETFLAAKAREACVNPWQKILEIGGGSQTALRERERRAADAAIGDYAALTYSLGRSINYLI